VKHIILAAGRGSRMGDKTSGMPKCLLVLGGKTLLQRNIETLEAVGASRADIGIVTGYRSDMIAEPGVRYFHNDEWETTNMFVSLTKAREWLINDVCTMIYADILYSPKVIDRLEQAAGDIVVPYYTKYMELWTQRLENPLDDLETFKFVDDRLTEIGKKPKAVEEVQGQYMGIIRLSPTSWKSIEEAVKLPMPKPLSRLDMTTLLQHLITLGEEVRVFPNDELWLECDTEQDARVNEKLIEKVKRCCI